MEEQINLRRLEPTLERESYPLAREQAAAAFDDVTLLLADGEAHLGSLIAQIDAEQFVSARDLATALHTVFPRRAVGEPFQSEGEG